MTYNVAELFWAETKNIVLGLLSWEQHVWNLWLISYGGLAYNKLKRIMCLSERGSIIRRLNIIVTAKKRRIVLLKRRGLVPPPKKKVLLSRFCYTFS